MRTARMMLLMGLSLFLIILPEPITTAMGLALLSWTLWRFGLWLAHANGTCRCDACRYGTARILSPHDGGKGSSHCDDTEVRIRRAQATLPLIQGRALAHVIGGSTGWVKRR